MCRVVCTLALLLLALGPANRAAAGSSLESGLWYDRQHQGHGLDLHRAGSTLFGAFYTYGVDGQTRWLWLQVDDRPDPAGPLLRVNRVADGLQLSPVGRFSVRPIDACPDGLARLGARALRQFEFELDGRSQSWCIEPLLPARPNVRQALDGAWYDPQEPGWGLFAHHYLQPDWQLWSYRSLYFHDTAGQPRWAFAQSPWSDNDMTQRYYTPAAECFGCPPPVALTSEVGLAWIDLQDSGAHPPAGSNPALIDLMLDGAPFFRHTTLRRLSDPRSSSSSDSWRQQYSAAGSEPRSAGRTPEVQSCNNPSQRSRCSPKARKLGAFNVSFWL